MSKNGLTWLIIIVALVTGGVVVWKTLPDHQKTFWKNFLKQIPDLPGRYMA